MQSTESGVAGSGSGDGNERMQITWRPPNCFQLSICLGTQNTHTMSPLLLLSHFLLLFLHSDRGGNWPPGRRIARGKTNTTDLAMHLISTN